MHRARPSPSRALATFDRAVEHHERYSTTHLFASRSTYPVNAPGIARRRLRALRRLLHVRDPERAARKALLHDLVSARVVRMSALVRDAGRHRGRALDFASRRGGADDRSREVVPIGGMSCDMSKPDRGVTTAAAAVAARV